MVAFDPLLCSRCGMDALRNKIRNNALSLVLFGAGILVCLYLKQGMAANMFALASLCTLILASSEDKSA